MYNIFLPTQQYDICIYFNITYVIILATCFDSSESSSGINIQELLVHIVLQYFTSYSNYCNRDPFMHYRIRADVYMVLGRGVVGSCFGVHFFVRIWGGGSHIGKSCVVALVFGFGMDLCQTSVILNRCIKRGFLVCINYNVHVGGTEFYLQIS